MSNTDTDIKITEAYRNYTLPLDVIPVVRMLVHYVPHAYLAGLRQIVLANSSGLARDRRRGKTWRRSQKVRIAEARGLYHAQWKGTPAWIEMFVNNIVEAFPPMLFRVPLFRDMVFAEVLYHEVGHHIHRTVRPEYQEREDVADKWRGILWWSFFRRRYWYLWPILYFLVSCLRAGKRVVRLTKKAGSRADNAT